MRLEEIGFYTLSDNRAKNASIYSPLQRCELLLTSHCNFNCPYCRGMRSEDQGNLSLSKAIKIIDLCASHNLQNIRFSGGEPTLWKKLPEIVKYSKKKKIKRIALSTNGSAKYKYYEYLANIGINDFSISLDSCCSSLGDMMTGKKNSWDTVVENIKKISKITYTTVGVVLTEVNYHEINDIVHFASNLGVHDIRIIPAAQLDKKLKNLHIENNYLSKHPILKYRYNNFLKGLGVRGLKETDSYICPLVLDDIAILNGKHYPCIIYLREQGPPIGTIKSMGMVRRERFNWFINHNCYLDPICKNNCLDVCVDYNNKWIKQLL